MADPAIVAEGLGKRFGHVTALDGVDLELPAGGVLGTPGRGRWAGRRLALASAAVCRSPETAWHACPQDLPSSVAAGAPPNCCSQIRT
jgi:hypothetical protein